MAKNMLKNYGRFELLELIYNMRKENLELLERAEQAERLAKETKAESDRKLEAARKDFESRIEELRMQGAAKDLQIRMKKIEEQLRLMQRLTSVDVDWSDMPQEEEIESLKRDVEEKAPSDPNATVMESGISDKDSVQWPKS